MNESSEHRTLLVYSLPAVGFGLLLASASIALTRYVGNGGFSWWAGQVLAVLVVPLIVALARQEILKGATYLHPRADLVAVAMAAVATVVGTGVLE